MDGRGPFCSLVMSVTVVKDVLVLLLFSINVEIVAAAEAVHYRLYTAICRFPWRERSCAVPSCTCAADAFCWLCQKRDLTALFS